MSYNPFIMFFQPSHLQRRKQGMERKWISETANTKLEWKKKVMKQYGKKKIHAKYNQNPIPLWGLSNFLKEYEHYKEIYVLFLCNT